MCYLVLSCVILCYPVEITQDNNVIPPSQHRITLLSRCYRGGITMLYWRVINVVLSRVGYENAAVIRCVFDQQSSAMHRGSAVCRYALDQRASAMLVSAPSGGSERLEGSIELQKGAKQTNKKVKQPRGHGGGGGGVEVTNRWGRGVHVRKRARSIFTNQKQGGQTCLGKLC